VETDPAALGRFCDQAQRSLFRLETLDHYDVGSDGGDFRRYLDGEDGPDPERKAAWHKVLQADLDRGVATRRVHVVRSPLSDYLRYEFEWGYAHNLDYEDILILDVAERATPAELDGIGDFWMADGRHVAIMRYDPDGRYLGFDAASEDEVRRYRRAADAAMRAGTSFESYMASHRIGRQIA
jgi:hypothetical protein